MQLPGADWWKAHNFVMREIAEQAGVAGVDMTLEPANVFHPELPSAVDVSDDRFKAVEGIRPDGLLRGSTTSIVELKVIRHTESWYGGKENMRAHNGNNRRAMDRRATRTAWEDKKKAKDLDDLFNDGDPRSRTSWVVWGFSAWSWGGLVRSVATSRTSSTGLLMRGRRSCTGTCCA
jgi:hypothetical protein